MRVSVDIFDANGLRIGEGPVISILSATVKRVLDGAGTINLSFPASDSRALELIQNEAHVVIYVEQDDERREFGRGIVRNIKITGDDAGYTITASGADSLDALKRRSVLLNRVYENQAIETIINGLVSLVPGWQADIEDATGASLQTARFDGASVLKSIVRVCEEKGIHFREGTVANTIDVGVFGTETDILLTNVPSGAREIYGNRDLILIDKLTQIQDSEAVANWIIPLGAGEGQAALTLKNSTRTTPYAVGTLTGPDGQTLYYLSDTTSNETYGQIEKIVTFKQIAPVANSTSAKTLAANALYDAAAAWLQRNSVRQTTYTVSGVKCAQQVKPGDKVRIVYKGVVECAGGDVSPLDVNDWFWVLSVNEKIAESGMSIDLEISSVDQMAETMESIIVGALETVEAKNVSVQTFPYWSENTYTDFIQGYEDSELSHPLYLRKDATFKLQVDELVTDIISVQIRMKTRPMHTFNVPLVDFMTPKFWYNYMIYQSSNYPSDLYIYINGVDVTTELGGPWNPNDGNLPVDVQLDITDYVINASGGLYQDHSILVRAHDKQGEMRVSSYFQPMTGNVSTGNVEMNIRVLGIAQAILPS